MGTASRNDRISAGSRSTSFGRALSATYARNLTLLTLAYAAAAVLGLQWALVPGAASPVWPAAGIAFAGLVLGGKRLWPAIVLGRLAAIPFAGPDSFAAIALIGLGNAAGALVAAVLFERLAGPGTGLGTSRRLTVLMAGALAGAAVSAVAGAATLFAFGSLPATDLMTAAMAWIWGNVVGSLVVAPFILSWATAAPTDWPLKRRLQLGAMLLVVAVCSALVFYGDSSQRGWFIYPVLVWAALSLPLAGVASALLLMSAFAIHGTSLDLGPFSAAFDARAGGGMVMLQLFLAVSSLTTLFLAVTAHERRSETLLRESADKLAAAERERAQSAHELNEFFTNAATGLAQIDPKTRIFVRVNPAFCEMTAYSAEELRALTVADITHPADRELDAQVLDAMLSGETPNYQTEKRYVRKDGAITHVVITATMIRDADGNPLRTSAVITDISARKAMEEQLALRTTELASLVDSAPIGTAFFDRGHRYVRINDYLADINGIPAPDHIGRSIKEVLPENAASVVPILDKVFETGEAVGNFEITGQTPREPGVERCWLTGFYPVLGVSGEVVSVGAWVVEITDRKATERDLEAAKEQLGLAMAAAHCGAWGYDLETNKPVWSREMFELYGIDPKTEPPRLDEFGSLVEPEHSERVTAEFADAIVKGGEFAIEFPVRTSDGSVRWIVTKGTVDKSAGAAGVARGVDLDITERKAALERETLLAREVDHRAKNMLALVQSVVHLSQASDPAELKENILGRIHSLARAHSLLAQGRWNGVALDQLVREELEPYADGSGKKIEVDGAPVLLKPYDAQSLGLVIHELATNAAKYGALATPKGRLKIRWRIEEEPATVRFEWIESGAKIAAEPTRSGFGTRVIQNSVERQLNGKLKQRWLKGGLHLTITFPAARPH